MDDNMLNKILKELKAIRGEAVGTNRRLDGLTQSFLVLQQGLADVRYDVHNIKEILSDRVIWQNDNISIMTKEGSLIYGIINKTSKKK